MNARNKGKRSTRLERISKPLTSKRNVIKHIAREKFSAILATWKMSCHTPFIHWTTYTTTILVGEATSKRRGGESRLSIFYRRKKIGCRIFTRLSLLSRTAQPPSWLLWPNRCTIRNPIRVRHRILSSARRRCRRNKRRKACSRSSYILRWKVPLAKRVE